MDTVTETAPVAPAQTVNIEGVHVSTEVLEAYADPKCSCTKGRLLVTRGGKTFLDVCFCAARRYYHQVILPERQEQTAVIKVRAREQAEAHVAEKLGRQRAELARVEERIAEAQARVDAAIADRQAEHESAQQNLADTGASIDRFEDWAAEQAVKAEDYAQQIHALTVLRERALTEQSDLLRRAEELRGQARAQAADVSAAAERVEEARSKVAGTLFRDQRAAEKLRRRIADTQSRNPEVRCSVVEESPRG